MKKHLIRIAKKNEFLYRIAKRFYRAVRPAAPTLYRSLDYLLAYPMKTEDELAAILAHYEMLRRGNTRLLILWEGDPLCLHRLMRCHPQILFLSMDYYARYHQKLMLKNMILLDAARPAPAVLEYI